MADKKPEDQGHVLQFRHRRSDELAPPDELAKYQRSGEPDDYRHRTLMNIASFVIVAGLIVAGLWLAFSIADLRKNQDCALTGRRGCLPIEVNRDR